MLEESLDPTQELEEEEALYEHYRIQVDKGQALLRIDRFLLDRLPNASRNRIQNGIKAESIRVNGKEIKPSYRVKPHDVITVSLPHPPREDVVVPEDIPLNIMYEDDSFLIVNKVAGMVVHPAVGNWTGTLVNALSFHLGKNLPLGSNTVIRPGLVHRIDKDTTGLLVIAKEEFAMTFLARQFFEHTSRRTYQALVWGIPDKNEGTIIGNIGRSKKDRKLFEVYADENEGKHAITHYKVLETFTYASLVECRLETGRTHQIRVHMKHIGHPLFGDAFYGGDRMMKGPQFTPYEQTVKALLEKFKRQALHAKTLGFSHPEDKRAVDFDSDLPEDMQQLILEWRKIQDNVR
jgi:23S rRNA pseudouridine1911/1915/1917 synthase